MKAAMRFSRRVAGDEGGLVALEFALVSFPFITMLLFIFELALGLFEQEALDGALHQAARQLQTGNAQNVQNGAAFITNYLCPDMGMLSCSGLNIQVQKVTPTATQDLYNFTTGTLPGSNGNLDLSSYSSGSFCNSGPGEFLIISAIYVAPTVIGGLVPGLMSVNYNGTPVHATLSSTALYSEGYTPSAISSGYAPAC